ncbi:MAG TPA: YciI family protein [Solirubrobacterales bacterium]|nr:YciI family protein [Solirubrobacterales bacterium]
MRFMMFMYPGLEEEKDWQPTPEAVAAMGRYNEELRRAGMLLSLDGLRPPSDGGTVSFAADGKASVTDGSFAEAKEVVGGYWLIQARSREEALEWASRCPARGCAIEVRRVAELEDFPQEVQDAYEGP